MYGQLPFLSFDQDTIESYFGCSFKLTMHKTTHDQEMNNPCFNLLLTTNFCTVPMKMYVSADFSKMSSYIELVSKLRGEIEYQDACIKNWV